MFQTCSQGKYVYEYLSSKLIRFHSKRWLLYSKIWVVDVWVRRWKKTWRLIFFIKRLQSVHLKHDCYIKNHDGYTQNYATFVDKYSFPFLHPNITTSSFEQICVLFKNIVVALNTIFASLLDMFSVFHSKIITCSMKRYQCFARKDDLLVQTYDCFVKRITPP